MSNETPTTQIDIRIYGELACMKVAPGDMIWFVTGHTLSDEARERVLKTLKKLFPHNQTVITDEGDRLVILTPDSGEKIYIEPKSVLPDDRTPEKTDWDQLDLEKLKRVV